MGLSRSKALPDLRDYASLSDAELLSILTGDTRGAARLVETHGPLNEIARLAPTEIGRVLTGVRTAKIAAALEIGRRGSAPRTRELVLSTPEDVFRYARPRLAHLTREVFHVLCLDTKHRLIADRRVAEGGLATCALSPRDVFEPAIRESAPALVFVHNHPSGDPTPSRDDVALTARLAEGAAVLGISFLDHVVIADGGFQSLRELGSL